MPSEKNEALKKLQEKEEDVRRDIKLHGKALGLYPHNTERILTYFLPVKEIYLNPGDYTEEEANLKEREGRSYLASPEIIRYNILVDALEMLFPNPEWKKKEEGTKFRAKEPVPA